MAIFSLPAVTSLSQEYVILMHGLCRSSRSMEPMRKALLQAGYCVTNINYPSRSASVEELSETVVGNALAGCRQRGAVRIHFVAHSLGGILVGSYFARHSACDLGRVVMLGPSNQGTELVDRLKSWPFFSLIHGPTGRELGTGANSLPNSLSAPQYCVGVNCRESLHKLDQQLVDPRPGRRESFGRADQVFRHGRPHCGSNHPSLYDAQARGDASDS